MRGNVLHLVNCLIYTSYRFYLYSIIRLTRSEKNIEKSSWAASNKQRAFCRRFSSLYALTMYNAHHDPGTFYECLWRWSGDAASRVFSRKHKIQGAPLMSWSLHSQVIMVLAFSRVEKWLLYSYDIGLERRDGESFVMKFAWPLSSRIQWSWEYISCSGRLEN